MKKLINKFCAVLLSLSIIAQFTGGGDLVYAAVNDNVDSSKIVLLVGEPAPGEPQTIFDWFRKVWLQLERLDSIERKIDAIPVEVAGLDSQLRDISATLKNTQAIMGGGCYYTIYTDREYLSGYKLTLTDGTMSKSCYIQYDDDSGKYTGVLSVSLGGTITIKVTDPSTKVVQGQVSTPASSNSYATINLDKLINDNLDVFLQSNDTIATSVYKDSNITQNTDLLQKVVNGVCAHDEHFSDFIATSLQITLSSKSIGDLLSNETEFVQVLTGIRGTYFINSAAFGNRVKDNKNVLSILSNNNTLVAMCNNSATFRSCLVNSNLHKITKTAAGGSGNSVSGNLICISVTSGSRGGTGTFDYYGGDKYVTHTVNASHSDAPHHSCYCTGTVASNRGSVQFVKNNVTSTLISPAAGSATHVVCRCEDHTGTPTGWSHSSWIHDGKWFTGTASANTSVNSGHFADTITVSGFGGVSLTPPACSQYAQPQNVSTSGSTANSVITYIDLDAVD